MYRVQFTSRGIIPSFADQTIAEVVQFLQKLVPENKTRKDITFLLTLDPAGPYIDLQDYPTVTKILSRVKLELYAETTFFKRKDLMAKLSTSRLDPLAEDKEVVRVPVIKTAIGPLKEASFPLNVSLSFVTLMHLVRKGVGEGQISYFTQPVDNFIK